MSLTKEVVKLIKKTIIVLTSHASSTDIHVSNTKFTLSNL